MIVVSRGIGGIVAQRCRRSAHLIANGVPLPDRSSNTDHLDRLGVQPSRRYILAVARFVPEKGLHDLVEAFTALKGDVQLVIAGDADHETDVYEGLPIALLEAMSYGLSVLVSDIPANMEVELPAHRYFRCGNVTDLGEKMASLLKRQMAVQEKEALRVRIAAHYDWRRIAGQTVAVYEEALGACTWVRE